MSESEGRYQLMWKAGGAPPKYLATFKTLEQVFKWLKNFHENTDKHSGFFSGMFKYYFIDRLTGHEVGSTLDLIDKEN